MAHVLYRFYSATGQLLYVGITMNPAQRFKKHRETKDWWSEVAGISIENYSTREDLANAERRAIQVEHPLHNIIHTKVKAERRRDPQERQPIQHHAIAPENTFPPAPFDSFRSLFSGSAFRDTRYGCATKEDYERRVAAERAKQQARWDCTLCDRAGYRPNGYLCDHIDHTSSERREALKRQLQIIKSEA